MAKRRKQETVRQTAERLIRAKGVDAAMKYARNKEAEWGRNADRWRMVLDEIVRLSR